MSSFSAPVFEKDEIISFFADRGIAAISHEDLTSPSSDFVCSTYSAVLSDLLDPSAFDLDAQIDFTSLELLHNPDHHSESLRKSVLFHTMKAFLTAIKFGDSFSLKDLVLPDSKRTINILSAIINFWLHREGRMELLEPLTKQLEGFEERRSMFEDKLSELGRNALEFEAAREMEQPIVEELQAEVKELKQTLHSLNKEQLSLKERAMALREADEAMNDKISKADFELVKNAQEVSLQRTVEEKKSLRTEELSAEKSAIIGFKERTTRFEVYSKVCEKLSRHFEKMEALQEQVNSTKALDKDVKALKMRLSDDGLLNRTLDAQIVEGQGKVMQTEDLLKEMQKIRGIKLSEQTKRLESMKLEMEQKMQTLRARELEAEAMVVKGELKCKELDSVKEARRIQEHKIHKKSEEVADEYRKYADLMNPILQGILSEISHTLDDSKNG